MNVLDGQRKDLRFRVSQHFYDLLVAIHEFFPGYICDQNTILGTIKNSSPAQPAFPRSTFRSLLKEGSLLKFLIDLFRGWEGGCPGMAGHLPGLLGTLWGAMRTHLFSPDNDMLL
jgi:hypothetical protein